MTARFLLAASVLAVVAALIPHHTPVVVAAGAAQATGQDSSTLDDQTELSLTVYNSDIALVRDVRNLQLPVGVFNLNFMDIAATVNPATVHIRSLSEPARLSVHE